MGYLPLRQQFAFEAGHSYVFHHAEPSDALTISGTGSNIIKLYYLSDPGDEPGPDTWQYTVKYLEQHTNHELHAEKVVSGKALHETVTEEAVSIAGYNTAGPASVTITIEAGDNEIVFYYTVRQYAVSFNANGGSAVVGQTVNHGEPCQSHPQRLHLHWLEPWHSGVQF